MSKSKGKLINHVALVVDDSPSMSHLISKTREVVDAQIRGFQKTSSLYGQNTRVSVYVFGGTHRSIVFDVDPEAVPRAHNYVHACIGATAMRDAVNQVLADLSCIDMRKNDHSFLLYVITDGEDNASLINADRLRNRIDGLSDDWTIAALVPNARGKHHCKICGLPSDNIEIWDTTSEQGMEEVGTAIGSSYTAYTMSRSLGVKSTKTLFKLKDVDKTDVKDKLEVIPASEYETVLVRPSYDGEAIKEVVERWTGAPYRVGSAYYQLTKPEKIQAGKQVAVVDKQSRKMYSGTQARKLLGLPNYEVKVAPADFDKFDVFVQSTSVNRKVVRDTHIIVFK